ncbi:MAG TPA: ABC transporter ATP-binding protein [Thermoanaerobaculia bacterium]|nr:ABC transporter ATP-binding protein [Thermoanaerobaculia bacterium]
MRVELEAADLSKSYAGRRVFAGLALSASEGLVAVAGPNGSGKTTFLKILAGLLRPDSGSVRVRRGGADLSGDARRQAIGWAGPDLSFYEDLTAEENLDFFRRAAGRRADPAAVGRSLAEVGLADAARLHVGAFSTGMKQRLRIAFATLFDAPILLLDEPMNGLDAAGREMVSEVVAARRREGAVVLASNDPRDLSGADAVVEIAPARARLTRGTP